MTAGFKLDTKMIEILDENSCNTILADKGLQTHDGKFMLSDGRAPIEEFNYVQVFAPDRANEIFRLSLRLIDWLPDGDWFLILINSYNYFDEVQRRFLTLGLSNCSVPILDGELSGRILFLPTPNPRTRLSQKFFVANFIYWMLIFEGHCQVISSSSTTGNYISINDAVAHLAIRRPVTVTDQRVASEIAEFAGGLPNWAIELNSQRQDMENS